MEIKFKPFGDNIIVKAPEINEKTDAGIIKPESILKEEEKKNDIYLEVIAVSDDITNITKGDFVLIQGGSHRVVEIDSIKCLIVYKQAVIGKKL